MRGWVGLGGWKLWRVRDEGRLNDVGRLRWVAFLNEVNEERRCGLSEGMRMEVNMGDKRPPGFNHRGSVKTDEGMGEVDIVSGEGPCSGADIVEGEDGIEAVLDSFLNERIRGLNGGAEVPALFIKEEHDGGWELPLIANLLENAGSTLWEAGGACVSRGEIPDAGSALAGDELECLLKSGKDIDPDGGFVWRAVAEPNSGGGGVCVDGGGMAVPVFGPDEEAVDGFAEEHEGEIIFILGGVGPVAGHDEIIPEILQCLFELEGEGGEEWILDIACDKTDSAGAAGAETAGDTVGGVAETFCGLIDAVSRLFAEAAVPFCPVENAGNGRGMDPGLFGNVFKCNRHGKEWC